MVRGQDIVIWNEDGTYSADVTSEKRLKVDAAIQIGAGTFVQAPPKTKLAEFIGQQVNTNILTPTAGKKIIVYGVLMDSSSTNSCCAKVNFVNGSGVLVWRIFIDKAKGNQGWMPLNIIGGINESLVVNTVNFAVTDELFIGIAYDEVD